MIGTYPGISSLSMSIYADPPKNFRCRGLHLPHPTPTRQSMRTETISTISGQDIERLQDKELTGQ